MLLKLTKFIMKLEKFSIADPRLLISIKSHQSNQVYLRCLYHYVQEVYFKYYAQSTSQEERYLVTQKCTLFSVKIGSLKILNVYFIRTRTISEQAEDCYDLPES